LPTTEQQRTGESLLAQFQTTFSVNPQPLPQLHTIAPQLPQPKLPPKRELATRILITLHDFPQENINPLKREPDFIHQHLLGWSPQAATTTKKAEKAVNQPAPSTKKALCAVTGQPARYCDPATGLYYIDAIALKSMRWVINSKGKWSTVTNTFAHATDSTGKGRPARGVPDMFLMTGEELEKRRVEVRKQREEEARVRAEQRAKAQAEAQARAEAQAKLQAQMQSTQPMQGGQQPVYRAVNFPQGQNVAQSRPPSAQQAINQYAPPIVNATPPGAASQSKVATIK
jgi:hypothetical protein